MRVGQYLRGRPVRMDLIEPYLESQVCQRWGCTPLELARVSAARVYLEIAFMQAEARARAAR